MQESKYFTEAQVTEFHSYADKLISGRAFGKTKRRQVTDTAIVVFERLVRPNSHGISRKPSVDTFHANLEHELIVHDFGLTFFLGIALSFLAGKLLDWLWNNYVSDAEA